MNNIIAGIDEVGRGPLAGPVVAATVILNPEDPIEGLADSKALSAKRREELAIIIKEKALDWAVGRAEAYEIDELNILQASLLAMKRAVNNLHIQPSKILVDGKHCPKLPYPSQAIIGGDKTIPSISAASILAKVLRDREMVMYDAYYPHYGFAKHKGYGTKFHMLALQQYGATPLHRKTFAPVTHILRKNT